MTFNTVSDPSPQAPLHVLSVSTMIRGNKAQIGCISREDWARAITISPYGSEIVGVDICLQNIREDKAFPDGQQRTLEIGLEYVSGGRKRRRTFGKVMGVTCK